MFNLKSTLLIFSVLFLGLFLKIIGFEPYPAIVLPSGSSTIKRVNNKVHFKETKIYALNSQGIFTEIDKETFLGKIPKHIIQGLIDRNFGMDKSLAISKSRKLKILKMLHLSKFSFFTGKTNASAEDTREVTHWLNERLNAQNLKGPYIKVVTYNNTVFTQTGNIIHTKIENERIITLSK